MKTNKALTFKQRLALAVHSSKFVVYYINPDIVEHYIHEATSKVKGV